MAIILSTKKLQSLLEEKRDSYVVFTQNKAGVMRVVGVTEYLEKGNKE
jgi:hypothetical protein